VALAFGCAAEAEEETQIIPDELLRWYEKYDVESLKDAMRDEYVPTDVTGAEMASYPQVQAWLIEKVKEFGNGHAPFSHSFDDCFDCCFDMFSAICRMPFNVGWPFCMGCATACYADSHEAYEATCES
jgi:hypothetical protein